MKVLFINGSPHENGCTYTALCEMERVLKEEGIEAIFSSPLGRAAETAAFTGETLDLPVQTLDFMRELHWGSVDGTPVPADGHPWDLADMLLMENC